MLVRWNYQKKWYQSNVLPKLLKVVVTSDSQLQQLFGDGKGHVGAGLGKATEIPEAIRKGKEDAAKNLIKVALDENESITHDVIGKFGSASVLLKKDSGRYWSYRRWSGSCGYRDGRYQEHPYKISGI